MLYDKKWDLPAAPAEIELEPWQQVLHKTADIIQRHGWCRYKMQNFWGQVCVLGAFAKVSETEQFDVWDMDKAACKFRETIPHRNIPEWNDDHATNKKAVIKALRDAAKT